jgi:hypothetical protein
MADSGISFKLLLDSSGFTQGVKNARDSMSKLIDEVGKKSFFEKLNTDIKRVGGSFANLGSQVGKGDIFGALATSSGLASSFIGEIGAAALPIAGVAIAATTATVVIKGLWDSMSRANEMKALAEGSLMTTRELMGLEQAFARVGIEMDEVPQLMGHFIEVLKELGDPSSKAATDFARIGLSLGSFQGKTAVEALYTFGNAVDLAKNKTDAFLAVQDAFGLKRAARVMPAIIPSNLAASRTETLEKSDIYEKMAPSFLEFHNQIKRLIPDIEGLAAGLASKVVPQLMEFSSIIERLDLAAFGAKIGNVLNPLTEAIGKIAYGFVALAKIFTLTPFSREEDKKRMEYEWQERRKEQLIPGYQRIPYGQSKSSEGGPSGEGAGKPLSEPYKSTNRMNELYLPQLPLPVITPIVDSLTKIGGAGNALKGEKVDVQREQLNVLRDISTSIRAFSNTFKPATNSYLPSMYGGATLVS